MEEGAGQDRGDEGGGGAKQQGEGGDERGGGGRGRRGKFESAGGVAPFLSPSLSESLPRALIPAIGFDFDASLPFLFLLSTQTAEELPSSLARYPPHDSSLIRLTQ